jgi:hypothetical protein
MYLQSLGCKIQIRNQNFSQAKREERTHKIRREEIDRESEKDEPRGRRT